MSNKDIEFDARKKQVLAPIYFEAGAALFDCQSFESGIAYFLYLLGRAGISDLAVDCAAVLDGDEKKTAGQLIASLKKKVKVSDDIENVLAIALQARNRLIHRYLYENVERLMDIREHESIVTELRELRSKVQRCQKELDPFVKHFAKAMDGIDMDAMQTSAKRKFIKDTTVH